MDPMDDFDTGIDCGMPAALVALVAIVAVVCVMSALVGVFMVGMLAAVVR